MSLWRLNLTVYRTTVHINTPTHTVCMHPCTCIYSTVCKHTHTGVFMPLTHKHTQIAVRLNSLKKLHVLKTKSHLFFFTLYLCSNIMCLSCLEYVWMYVFTCSPTYCFTRAFQGRATQKKTQWMKCHYITRVGLKAALQAQTEWVWHFILDLGNRSWQSSLDSRSFQSFRLYLLLF